MQSGWSRAISVDTEITEEGRAVRTSVSEMIDVIEVEGTFPDGTKLVTIRQPIR